MNKLIAMSVFAGALLSAFATARFCQSSLDRAQAEETIRGPRQRDEVNAEIDSKTHFALIDVNDSFLVYQGAPKKLANRLSLAILDGFRSTHRTCPSAHQLKAGEPRTTWLHIEHTNYEEGRAVQVIASRTLSFYSMERRYEFSVRNDGETVVLDPGVTVNLKN